MDFLSPSTWEEALAVKSAHPDAVPIMGGTDVMVELNFDKHRPPALIDLTRVPELTRWAPEGDGVLMGAGLSYTRIIGELAGHAPALAQASRSVASPQIRNRGSVGGNLGGASPSGEAHPPLLATDAVIELASVRGTRRVPAREFYLGLRHTARAEDELIAAVLLPRPAGPQYFAKIGTRNAMVIAVASFAIALDAATRTVGTGVGSCAPTPIRAVEAEEFIAGELDWDGGSPLAPGAVTRFGELVASVARPIDDVRGSADYRKHALSVMARRTLAWAVTDHRKGIEQCA
ncbi:CO/xanthine dehydrogenase FAD-binding subunit [Murinocardiopsis flavida]|uniref:CO/xanthine dehydrogenase FAD-binding subunit n=1 Tax=Murinocardiopsis flavida TaxID=645275 RepID=A0A2P8DPC6_9ACTN|nr:FAD binding domain-containing protein [Murinocardiopsis flavida]PSK99068.1 CO/xanthine dehydrogenase FAD-binding subunit [Murinocardiopsis flavida]